MRRRRARVTGLQSCLRIHTSCAQGRFPVGIIGGGSWRGEPTSRPAWPGKLQRYNNSGRNTRTRQIGAVRFHAVIGEQDDARVWWSRSQDFLECTVHCLEDVQDPIAFLIRLTRQRVRLTQMIEVMPCRVRFAKKGDEQIPALLPKQVAADARPPRNPGKQPLLHPTHAGAIPRGRNSPDRRLGAHHAAPSIRQADRPGLTLAECAAHEHPSRALVSRSLPEPCASVAGRTRRSVEAARVHRRADESSNS